ncbi:hypothetical protein ABT364_11375 [Massilia sp. SR12]
MKMGALIAERMFSALKKLSDLAQESCLTLPNSGAPEKLVREHRHLMGEILGRAYDPFLYQLISKHEAPTMERLRERIPLPYAMSAQELMCAVIVQGNSLFDEFGEVMRQGEREGLFREGSVENLFQDLQNFNAWLMESGARGSSTSPRCK